MRARGGIPSLERALGDPETRGAAGVDGYRRPIARGPRRSRRRGAARDGSLPPIPDAPARAASWAEWLYFNGRGTDARFYLTFSPARASSADRRIAGVRLQLERDGG